MFLIPSDFETLKSMRERASGAPILRPLPDRIMVLKVLTSIKIKKILQGRLREREREMNL